jgi:hypothetical protein
MGLLGTSVTPGPCFYTIKYVRVYPIVPVKLALLVLYEMRGKIVVGVIPPAVTKEGSGTYPEPVEGASGLLSGAP